MRAMFGLALVGSVMAAGVGGLRHERSSAQQAVRADSIWLVATDTGNSARYRVREQLVGFDFPNDAVGSTGSVTGFIVVDASGRVSPRSKFDIDMTQLKSDQARRDGYVRSRILETDKYPTVTLAVTRVEGLKLPLPATGAITFSLVGNLTVRGVTRVTTWKVAANMAGDIAAGTASTAFTFEDFSLPRPRVPVLMSVADTIKLEYDFRLTRK